MNNTTIKHSFTIIENNKNCVFFIAGKKNLALIEESERLLKVSLPDSYKIFLEQYGLLMFDGFDIFGIGKNENLLEKGSGNFTWLTIDQRELTGIPDQYVLISDTGDGAYYALDTSRMNEDNECPVVLLDYVHGEEPFDVAEDFGQFLLDQLNESLEDN